MFRQTARSFSAARSAFSAYSQQPRKTLKHLNELYQQKSPISVVTAWDYLTAQIAEKADIDITLVGDSLAMVALGYEDTNEIGLDEFLYHVRAVARGNRSLFVVADVPFGTFEASDADAVRTAVALVKNGRAQGVKIEGGASLAPAIQKIVQAGVPVMGHVGLAPQKHHATGGYRLQGNSLQSAVQILDDCRALEAAGVFALVLECVPNKFAEIVTALVSVPVIGIGAGPHVSGQVLVMADMLGMGDKPAAKFVKQYASFFADAHAALAQYKADLATGAFPDPDIHGYKMKGDVLRKVREHASAARKQ
ncbi:ketopantoate hydroxymethyltransferase [Metschnikowia bicuspidata var. bicuspidata NRRL YB-4993]|uniref:3-methyl-2-oxobutanoate hydroxymethyltransferase n=1 Tax=Metschnikowia bicuspidata var. bicuspidata NRRL YB-4993 TaxID=869754 RepID=A0A1A0H5G5_9ASCO|nr:ketopantoate hydroxymethyltransferase [Metschnikowia bicuspidata var. bicuspidata NRRL YB-4993]OBA19163.1 ketopantoate hydroxymethyltransferase [Metschnikowia bicuspidata var. bicuspidata NRRL YB-4993]